MKKSTTQLAVVLVVVGLWAFGLLLAVWDGNTILKATTPMMTLVFGWLFAERVTET